MPAERKAERISLGVEGLFYIKGSNTILLDDRSLTLNLLREFMVGEMKDVPMEELSKTEHREALIDAILEITVYGGAPNIDSTNLAE